MNFKPKKVSQKVRFVTKRIAKRKGEIAHYVGALCLKEGKERKVDFLIQIKNPYPRLI